MTAERLEALESDVNHVMGRGETSNVSGIPTLSRLLTDIDGVKSNHTKITNDFDSFKANITEKLDEEVKAVTSFVKKHLKTHVIAFLARFYCFIKKISLKNITITFQEITKNAPKAI